MKGEGRCISWNAVRNAEVITSSFFNFKKARQKCAFGPPFYIVFLGCHDRIWEVCSETESLSDSSGPWGTTRPSILLFTEASRTRSGSPFLQQPQTSTISPVLYIVTCDLWIYLHPFGICLYPPFLSLSRGKSSLSLLCAYKVKLSFLYLKPLIQDQRDPKHEFQSLMLILG